ncbi:MAG: hypothetical protein ACOCV8_01110 [Spirochaetota bacterium]
MSDSKITLKISEKEFNNSIKNISKEINTALEKEYRQKFKSTIKNIFSDLNQAMNEGFSKESLNQLAQNSLSSLTNLLVPGLSDTLTGVINLSINAIQDIFSDKEKIEIEKQKQAIENINNELSKRNNLLEIAKSLNANILDTSKEQLEYQKESAEILLDSLNLGSDIENINPEEVLSNYEELNNKLKELKDAKNNLESDLADDNVLDSVGNWISSLWGDSKEDRISVIEAEIEKLEMETEQYEDLLNLVEQIRELRKQEIEDLYKEKELSAELEGNQLDVYDAKIGYYRELLNSSEELELSNLEILETEKKLQELIKERTDYLINNYDKEQELAIKKAKLNGATEEELNQLRLKAVENLIEAKQTEINTLGSTIERESQLVDLELERLSLEKEINGELETQGVLYDKNIRNLIRASIEAKKKGDISNSREHMLSAAQALINEGLSINEANNILGLNPTEENLNIPSSEKENNLPSNQELVSSIANIESSISNTVEVPELISTTNNIMEEELQELQSHHNLLSNQNNLLHNINENLKEGKEIHIRLENNSVPSDTFSNGIPSQWSRFTSDMYKQNRK